LTIASPQSQKSKPIELKFGTKEHERGTPNSVIIGEGGRVGITVPQSPKFHKNRGFGVDFLLPSARLYIDHAKIWL